MKKKNIGFFSDTVKVLSSKLCTIGTLLGVYIVSLMALTLFQITGVSEIYANCLFCILVLHSFNFVRLLHTVKRLCTTWFVWLWCVFVMSWEIIHIFFVGQVSGLVRGFNIWIFTDTINVINVKLCMMVLLIELYLFIPLQWPLLYFKVTAMLNNCNWKFILHSYPIKLKLCRIVK